MIEKHGKAKADEFIKITKDVKDESEDELSVKLEGEIVDEPRNFTVRQIHDLFCYFLLSSY